MEPRIVHPAEGVDAFRIGTSRPQIWALTDSTITAFLRSGDTERTDDLLARGIHVEYRDGTAFGFTIFPRLAGGLLVPIELFAEEISAFTRADVRLLLQVQELEWTDGYEEMVVPSLALTFWFREADDDIAPLEFVRVEPLRTS